MYYRPSVIAALLALLATPASAGNVIDPYTLFPPSSPSYTPQAVNCSGSGDMSLAVSSGLSNAEDTFILAFAFETPEFTGSTEHWVVRGTSSFYTIHFTGTSETERTLNYLFKNSGSTILWQGTVNAPFQENTKYAIAFSFSNGVRNQVFVNGTNAAITNTTLVYGAVNLSVTPVLLCTNFGDTLPFNGRLGSFWLSNSDVTLNSTTWADYFDGSNNPKDSANGAEIWFDWFDYLNGGSGTATITNNGTTLEAW